MNIWVPKRGLLIPRREIVLPSVRVAGMYKIEAVRLDGSKRLLADWFPNLITNTGLDDLGYNGTGSSPGLNNCYVGSGNSTPAYTNTALQTLVGSTNNIIATSFTAQGSSPYFGSTTYTYQFAIGSATGNLAEVGVGGSSTALFSRALILDGGGSPTTITVLSSEALNVTYQLNQYVPLTDVTGSITISGTSYGYTLRAANATQAVYWSWNGNNYQIVGGTVFNGSIGAITGSPVGASASATSRATSAYSAGSYSASGTFTYGLSDGNVSGGITSSSWAWGINGSLGLYQIGFSTPIPKTSSYVLTLEYGVTWSRGT